MSSSNMVERTKLSLKSKQAMVYDDVKGSVDEIERNNNPRSVANGRDNYVASCVKGQTIITRRVGEETAMLKSTIEFLANSGSYWGSLYTKPSFMKRKGGRLL